jgi:hypothetical protein
LNSEAFFARFAKLTVLLFFILLFFFLMSRVDFIVNSTLYKYGLTFSYDWANAYWIAFDALFAAFSAMAAYVYWFGSSKTKCDKKIVVALLVTINALALGGLEDVLYFTFWGGGLPADNVVWWWSQWHGIFGTWNSTMQVELIVGTIGFSVVAWVLAFHQKKKTCDYPL